MGRVIKFLAFLLLVLLLLLLLLDETLNEDVLSIFEESIGFERRFLVFKLKFIPPPFIVPMCGG